MKLMLEFPLSGERLTLKSPDILSHSCPVDIQKGKNTKPYLRVVSATGSSSGCGQDWMGAAVRSWRKLCQGFEMGLKWTMSVHLCVLGTRFIAKAQGMFAELLNHDFYTTGHWATDLRPTISSKWFGQIEEGKKWGDPEIPLKFLMWMKTWRPTSFLGTYLIWNGLYC